MPGRQFEERERERERETSTVSSNSTYTHYCRLPLLHASIELTWPFLTLFLMNVNPSCRPSLEMGCFSNSHFPELS